MPSLPQSFQGNKSPTVHLQTSLQLCSHNPHKQAVLFYLQFSAAIGVLNPFFFPSTLIKAQKGE